MYPLATQKSHVKSCVGGVERVLPVPQGLRVLWVSILKEKRVLFPEKRDPERQNSSFQQGRTIQHLVLVLRRLRQEEYELRPAVSRSMKPSDCDHTLPAVVREILKL